MRIALTGASGLVGRFIETEARAAGHEVTRLTRRPGPGDLAFDLSAPPPDLSGHDALIHCAFDHVPGRYRGGEGDDPDGFALRNRDGSLRLFRAARACGVGAAVFLSTRAVYGAYPPGTPLTEDLAPRPDTLYGRVKAEVEAGLHALAAPGFAPASLRATGVYGPGPDHKWQGLFAAYLAGRPVAARVATEVHGADVAAACLALIGARATGAFNCSDLLLDQHDLLAEVQRLTGCPHDPPPRADAGAVSAMDCTRLQDLGWRPGGWARLRAALPAML
ncbi:NAD-dependent epimerase/dehydratase family protein [Frigidibacter sp. MR17.24]|uniref:NAD-dependent epimerase/dehydratase family protein n=1 Tax=Frigidibacter sp. MR17.24 TaxID=3127345 RepID=UPI003012DE06